MNEEKRPSAPDRSAWVGKLQYSRSFMAKLSLSSPEVREYYALLVTELLSYEKMNARVGWAGVTFMAGRRTAARLIISGKTLCLFLAADPETVTGARYKALAVTAKKYEKTPALLKIRSRGAARNAERKIAETAAGLGLSKRSVELPAVSAKNFPADNFGNLLARGLIRILHTGKGTAFLPEEEEILPEEPGDVKPSATGIPAAGNEGSPSDVPAGVSTPESNAAGRDTTDEEAGHADENKENPSKPPLSEAENTEEEDKPSHPKHTDRAYADTVKVTKDLLSRHDDYAAIMGALGDGEASVRVTDRYVVRAIDELWVRTIEDSLFAIDEIIRHPTGYIAETEEVLPIEMTKKVTGRSIVHLAQHSDYISKDEDDRLTPTKLLNVFREDSLLTYENKFINTLLSRLAFFIDRRYEVWTRRGADERIRRTEFCNRFELGDTRGKVTVTVEMSEQTENDGGVRNTTYDTDLFRRVSRLHGIAESYMKSPFVRNMGKNYVHPPILRTNVILKNKYFRQCLALWEFIESYEDAGYGLLVEEKAVHVSRKYLCELYEGAAMQYLLFCHEVCEGSGTGHNLSVVFASAGSKLQAEIDGSYHYPDDEENTFAVPGNDAVADEKTRRETYVSQNETEIIAAVEAALLADEMSGADGAVCAEMPDAAGNADDDAAEDLSASDAAEDADGDVAEALPFSEAPAPDGAESGNAASAGSATAADDGQTDAEDLTDEQLSALDGRLYRSFTARLCEMEDEGKENLAAIANHILRYPKVSMRVSRDFMTFRHKKRTIARIAIRGKSLYVYLPQVSEEDEKRFRLRRVEDVGRLEGTPLLLPVRSARSLRYAIELTGRICDSYGIGAPLPDGQHPVFRVSDYPRRSLREMLAMGLVHISGKLNGVPEEGFSAARPRDDSTADGSTATGETVSGTEEYGAAASAETTSASAEKPPRHALPKEAEGEPLRPAAGTLPYAGAQQAAHTTAIPEGAPTVPASLPAKAPDPTPDHDTSAAGERVGMEEQPLSWQANEDYSQPEMFGLDDSSAFMEDIREQEMKNRPENPEKKHEKTDKD